MCSVLNMTVKIMKQQILHERYQLQKRLSKKGNRQTFIAQDLMTQQQVVVKILLFGLGFEWQDHKLFERGAAALKRLSFPGIPRYLDYFDVEIDHHKGFAQVQTYIPARSLQEQMQASRTFSDVDLRQLAQQLLKILQYLHQRQPSIIHRDIKPSNILLEDRTGSQIGQVYLVDFDSIRTDATRSEYTMTIVGTYGYMPPEQFGGDARPASDLYSLGATLIYAASGKHPTELPHKNMRIEFGSEVSLDTAMVSWLKWMTNPDLDHRPDSATIALQALENPGKETHQEESLLSNIPINLPVKPVNSNIMVSLTHQPKTIEILIPPKGLNPLFLSLFIFVGAPTTLTALFLALGIIHAFLDGQLFVGLLFFLVLLPIILVAGATVLPFAIALLQQIQLHIDPHTITETYKFIKTRRRSTSRSKVQLISDRKMSSVSLKTSAHTFVVPVATPEERTWLTHTLSQWLQLPVKYR